jgi:phenylpyruvate tautomerase PptA (4-oxalocrotonate tautomerase family)
VAIVRSHWWQEGVSTYSALGQRPVRIESLRVTTRSPPVPHLTLYALEPELAGRESSLIGELTSAVVSVYGEWARGSVDVRLVGIPVGRWARGGVPVTTTAPSVTFGMREEVFARDDAERVVAQLVSAVTGAVTAVFGDGCRDQVLVELVGQPTSRSGLGGSVISDGRAGA